MRKRFQYGETFPHEAFVQRSLERYFTRGGYTLVPDGQADLIAKKPGETWFIEAKGATTAPGLDFNTALGQLLKWMSSPDNIYAVAVPKDSRYQRQCCLLPRYVRELLKLRILVVDPDGSVAVVEPGEDPARYFAP